MSIRELFPRILVVAVVVGMGLVIGATVRYPALAIRLVAHVPGVGPPAQAWLADRLGAGRLVDHEHDGLVEYWTCSMHPSVRHLEPGSCPICGMDLVPVYQPGMEPSADDASETDMAGMSNMPGMGPPPQASGGTPADRATFQVQPQWQQAIGVTTAPVGRHALSERLRAVGQVAIDENRLVDVNLRVSGWIEELHVAETGQLVHAGDVLFDLYSPELVSTQGEYLLARDNATQLDKNPEAELRARSRSLVRTALRRLQLWGLTDAQIQRLDADSTVIDSMPIAAPATGYVVEKNAVQGMRVDPGMRLYRIADLSSVWVVAEIYESELAFVRKGMRATLSLAHTNRERTGTVDFIYPTVDRATRTVRVRLVFSNDGLELMPGMYGDVSFEARSAAVLAVPREAIIDTGSRRILFVDLGGGRLQAREVRTGGQVGKMVPVLAGVVEGEMVVTSGNFLIDAESKIRGVVALPVVERQP